MMGDGAILKTMGTDADATVTACERTSKHAHAVPEGRSVFACAHQAEQHRHAWMENAAARA